jgi:hypothetical protein
MMRQHRGEAAMDKDSNKPADQRGGEDRRHEDDPDFGGPERREKDRRKEERKPV